MVGISWRGLRPRHILGLLGIVVLGITTTWATAEENGAAGEAAVPTTKQVHDPEGILNMDIEQLAKVDVRAPAMNIEVTSVSKEKSTVGHSPAAIYVITSEMIAHSAANNIPDLLRLVPGVEVARIDAHSWAITIRGFNGRFADKLLVLIDGRTVFSPITAGVYWDVQDLVLADIARIEVIRGPGGTIWGSNANNGVINIITKKAKDTQGAMLTYGGGSEDLGLGSFRYGSAIGDNLHYRIYGKHKEEAAGFSPDGNAHDDWRQGRAGFRADWEPDRDKSNLFTIQGDYYVGADGVGALVPVPITPYVENFAKDETVEGGNILARLTHTLDEDSDWSLQAYFDRSRRANEIWTQDVRMFDVEFLHHFPLGRRHDLIWGVEYRNSHDDEACPFYDGFVVNFDPLKRTVGWLDIFVQDKIALVHDRLFLTLGSKFERNDYTGFECQPSIRLLLTPDEKRSAWVAVSRAVSTPLRFDTEGSFTSYRTPFPRPIRWVFPRMYGNPDQTSEALIAYEVGYRAQPIKEFAYDIALYYFRHDNTGERIYDYAHITQDQWGNYILPVITIDGGAEDTYGGEFSTELTMSERWRLSGSYSWEPETMRSSPRNQVKFMSSWDLGRRCQFDMILRYVDDLRLGDTHVPSYVTMDLRLAWQARRNLEFAVIGRNLLQEQHLEFGAGDYPYYVTEVERSVFGNMTYRF